MTARRQLVHAALASALALASGLCGGERPRPPHRSDVLLGELSSPPERVSLGRLAVRAHPFEGGALRAAEPVRPWPGDALEFLALADAPDRVRMAVVLEDAATGAEIERRPVEPQRAGIPSAAGPGLARAFARVRVDLSDHAGRELSVSWEIEPQDGTKSWVGLVRLSRARERGSRPDVLVICSDTHRVDHSLGEAGRRDMPRLARLAESSVVYENALSTSSWTLPAVASLLTGLDARLHTAGFREHDGFEGDEVPPGYLNLRSRLITAFPGSLRTLGEELRGAGYDTVLVAGNRLYGLSGLGAEGFDLGSSSLRTGRSINAAARSVLERHPPRRPLFMLAHYMDVHDWFLAAERQGLFVRRRGRVGEPAEYREAYAVATRRADRHLGVLLDAWDASRGRENSLVVFLSDHGEHLLEPRTAPSSTPAASEGEAAARLGSRILGHGRSMQDVLLRIPLVVRYPEGLGENPRIEERPVSLIDVMPTVLDVANARDAGLRLDGRSLLDAPRDGEPPRPFFADYQLYGDELASVLLGPRKLVVNVASGEEALFDAGSAAQPLVDGDGSAADDARGRRRLRALLDGHAARADAETAGLRSDREIEPDEALDVLRSLGYAD